jgi:hypothetical protein
MLDSNKSPKKSSLKGRNTPPAEPNPDRLRDRLVVMGTIILMIPLTGCASTGVQDADPLQYNPNTGYPAVGGPPWHL